MDACPVIQFINVFVLRNHKLLEVDFWVSGGKIIDPAKRFWASQTHQQFAPCRVVDGKGRIIAPGFIDVQINGVLGVDFSDPLVSAKQLASAMRALFANGVTSICPTIVTSSPETYVDLSGNFSRTLGSKNTGPRILGVHLEGPFLNPDCRGAHSESNLRVPINGAASVHETYGALLDHTSIVTIAPELPGALETIRYLTARGIIVSAGHSMATSGQADSAVAHGVTSVTHLFNAMTPFHHRDPGLIGLLSSAEQRIFFGIIVDGIHSHPHSVKMAFSAHARGCVLVTDAISGLGLPPGTHTLAGKSVIVDDQPSARLTGEEETLAGAVMPMDACVRKFMRCTNCSKSEALEAASFTPAKMLGLEREIGSLSFGASADFIVLSNELEVEATYVSGVIVWDRENGFHLD